MAPPFKTKRRHRDDDAAVETVAAVMRGSARNTNHVVMHEVAADRLAKRKPLVLFCESESDCIVIRALIKRSTVLSDVVQPRPAQGGGLKNVLSAVKKSLGVGLGSDVQHFGLIDRDFRPTTPDPDSPARGRCSADCLGHQRGCARNSVLCAVCDIDCMRCQDSRCDRRFAERWHLFRTNGCDLENDLLGDVAFIISALFPGGHPPQEIVVAFDRALAAARQCGQLRDYLFRHASTSIPDFDSAYPPTYRVPGGYEMKLDSFWRRLCDRDPSGEIAKLRPPSEAFETEPAFLYFNGHDFFKLLHAILIDDQPELAGLRETSVSQHLKHWKVLENFCRERAADRIRFSSVSAPQWLEVLQGKLEHAVSSSAAAKELTTQHT